MPNNVVLFLLGFVVGNLLLITIKRFVLNRIKKLKKRKIMEMTIKYPIENK